MSPGSQESHRKGTPFNSVFQTERGCRSIPWWHRLALREGGPGLPAVAGAGLEGKRDAWGTVQTSCRLPAQRGWLRGGWQRPSQTAALLQLTPPLVRGRPRASWRGPEGAGQRPLRGRARLWLQHCAPAASLLSPARLPALASTPRPQAKPPLCSLWAMPLPVWRCVRSHAAPWCSQAGPCGPQTQSHQGCTESRPQAKGQQTELTQERWLASLRVSGSVAASRS